MAFNGGASRHFVGQARSADLDCRALLYGCRFPWYASRARQTMLERFNEQRQRVIAALEDLGGVAGDLGARTLASRLGGDLVHKLQADRFHLVVVGEFNHGKSALVNAMLGHPVLPVGVTPTTATIHHVVYASEPSARLVTGSDDEVHIPFESVREYGIGGGRGAESLKFIEVSYPAELLRERLVLVDTPGVNDLSLTRAEITYGYIPRADAVLFVLDAGQPVKESERLFLQGQLIARSRDKIVFVVAKADIWTAEERMEALAYVRGRLGEMLDEPKIFAVSSQAALAGRSEESGLPALLEYLNRFLAEERGRILLENALGEGLAALGVLGRGMDARQRAARMSPEQLDKRIELLEADLSGRTGTLEERRLAVRAEVASVKAWARRDLDRFCDDVVRELPEIVARATATDLKAHLGAFLEHRFKEWARAETTEIANALETLAERMATLLRDDAHELGRSVGEAMSAELKAPSIEVDTLRNDVGVVAVLSLGMGMLFANVMLGVLLLAAAPVLALWNRDRTEAEVRRRARELGPLVLRDAAARVAPKIDEMVDDFGARLDSWVVTVSQELHREIIEVLQDVRSERERSPSRAGEELEVCARAAARIGELSARLQELRDSLGESGGVA